MEKYSVYVRLDTLEIIWNKDIFYLMQILMSVHWIPKSVETAPVWI